MLREVVHETPVEVLVHIAEAVALVREHEHVETLAGLDEGIHYSGCVARVYIVVNVSVNEEEVALEL